MRPLSPFFKIYGPILLVLAATLAVFAQTCGFDFVEWDDPYSVFRNPFLHPANGANLLHFWTHAYFELYIPLTSTLWWLCAQIAPLREPVPGTPNPGAAVVHGLNVALHLADTFLVWHLLRVLLARLSPLPLPPKVSEKGARRDLGVPAAAGAALFALHPLQVESVAWVTGMNNLLSGFFVLAALLVYLSARGKGDEPLGRPRRCALYALATGFYLLALLSKPSAAATPLLALVLDIGTETRQSSRNGVPLLRDRRWLLSRFGLPVFWLVFAVGGAVVARLTTTPVTDVYLPIWGRPVIAGYALAFYIEKLIAPFRLAVDYGRLPFLVLHQWWGYAAAALIAALAVVIAKKGSRPTQVGAIFTVAALSPTLGFVPFYLHRWSTVGDRYMYLAMIGPALMIAWTWLQIGKGEALTPRLHRLLMLLYGLLVLAWACLSAVQTATWKSTETLFEQTLSVNPESKLSLFKLGKAREDNGDPDAALALYQKAVHAASGFAPAYYNVGSLLARSGKVDEGIGFLCDAIRADPAFPEAHLNLGLALEIKGKWAEALREFETVLSLRPGDAAGQQSAKVARDQIAKGGVFATQPLRVPPESDPVAVRANAEGAAAARAGDLDGAERAFRAAIRARPDDAGAFFRLGITLDKKGSFALSERAYGSALRRRPHYPEAHFNRGMALARMGNDTNAVSEWQEAEKEKPGWDLPLRALQTVGAGSAANP